MSRKITKSSKKIVLFRQKEIRRTWHDDEWYYSVVDIVEALSDSPAPRQYWGKVKTREFTKVQLSPIWVQLKMPSADGKNYRTDCVNTKSALRLIQSIPSKKAEPFKRWLAQIGQERIEEIENPELAQERMKDLYEKKGYPQDWVDFLFYFHMVRNRCFRAPAYGTGSPPCCPPVGTKKPSFR